MVVQLSAARGSSKAAGGASVKPRPQPRSRLNRGSSPRRPAAMAVYRCSLCRRTFFTGRRHLYSTAHRRRLQEALGRLEEEVAAARAALDGAAVRRYDPAEHERRVWCLCCGRGVRRDGRSGALALPHAGLLQHLAGAEHRRETVRFWRENRADAALRERFVVPAEEYERFAAALRKAVGAHEEREEENIRQMAARIREAERRQRDTVRAALEVGAAELSPSSRDRALCWTSRLQLRCGIRPVRAFPHPSPGPQHPLFMQVLNQLLPEVQRATNAQANYSPHHKEVCDQ
uniref:Coiled-coil domain containing 84 n=1 Tax=Phasianus colchicus TaxID=9054 RepID=A0A669PZG5_PHACC